MSNDRFPGWWPLLALAMIVATVVLACTHSPTHYRPADCPVGIPQDEC